MSTDIMEVGEPGTRVHIPAPRPARAPIVRPIIEAAPAWIAHQKHESHPVVFGAGVVGVALLASVTTAVIIVASPFLIIGLAVREYVRLHLDES